MSGIQQSNAATAQKSAMPEANPAKRSSSDVATGASDDATADASDDDASCGCAGSSAGGWDTIPASKRTR